MSGATPVPHGTLPDLEDPRFAPFWRATGEGRIDLPQCENCDTLVWPPRPVCPVCLGDAFRWSDAGTRGEIYSWTVVHHATVDTMPGPYIVVVVALSNAPGVRLLGNMWSIDEQELAIGLPVEASFDDVGEGTTLVNWRPITTAQRHDAA